MPALDFPLSSRTLTSRCVAGLTALIFSGACIPKEPVTPDEPSVLKLSMLSPSASIEVTRPGIVRVQWTGRGGVAVKGVSTTWTQRAPQVVQLQSPAEDSVVVTGLAPGVDTIGVTGRFGGVTTTGFAVVEVRRRSAAQLEVQPRVSYLPVGGSLRLSSVARDSSDTVVPLSPRFASTVSSVATVDSTGTVTALGAGSTLIIAALDQSRDTVRIAVNPAGTLRASFSGSRLVPGSQFGVTLSSTADLTARVGDTPAHTTATSPTSAEITVPTALFEPCLRPGLRFPLVLKVGGDSLIADLEAAEKPFVVDFAVGQSLLTREPVVRRCRIEAKQPGTYLVMPFRTDTPEGWGSFLSGSSDTIQIALSATEPMPSAAASLGAGSSPASSYLSSGIRAPFREGAAFDVVMPHQIRGNGPPVLPTATSCTPVSRVGDTLRVRTTRDSQGRVSVLGGTNVEPWVVVGVGSRIVAVADTSAIRLSPPSMRDSVAELVAGYDSTIAPVFDRYFDTPLPDRDENGGRIVMLLGLNNGVPASGLAYPKSSLRADCTTPGGEYVWLNVTPWTGNNPFPFTVASALQTLSHEAMHVYDMSRWPVNKAPYSWWIAEGMAEFGTHLWVYSDMENPIAGGISRMDARPFLGYYKIPTCLSGAYLQSLANMYRPYGDGYARGYQIACTYIVHLLQRATLEQGRTVRKAVSDWSRLSLSVQSRTFGAISNAYLQQSRPDVQVVADWLISWYAAGGYVPGLAPALSNPLFNPRVAYENAITRFPLPNAHLNSSNPTARFDLGEPDVRHVEWNPESGEKLWVFQSAGKPAANLMLVVLRAR